MSERSDPSALRWLIGNELRQYRTEAQQTVAAASQALECSHGKITHLETGRYQQQPEEIAALLRFYGAEQHDVDRLTALAGQSNSSTWWAPWANIVPDWFKTFVGLEGLAESEFVYEPVVVPGLLQTEEYAHALTKATGFVRPDHSERFVSFRLARARRLTDPQPLRLHAVVPEAALRLRVGDSQVRLEQYQHLLAIAERPNVTFQVVRPEEGPHAAATGQFVILDFTYARPIAYAELLDGAMYIQDQDQTRTYRMAAESVQKVALDHDESVALIESLASAE